ncbi:MAG: zinc ribbon domain-containing protein [Lachnospiraceae bacterium]|nr:zinc ribbon domain-containing protein [Lachnospiraceae bacterium]
MAQATTLDFSMILLIYIIIMSVATVFVYRDAKKRDVNEKIWALITLVAPFLLGLIIYLVSRPPLVELKCPKCGSVLQREDKVCPECNVDLLTKCPNCEFPIQKGWKSCPKCGNGIENDYEQPISIYQKDKGLGIVGIIVIILVVCIFISFTSVSKYNTSTAYSSSYGGLRGMYNITKEDLSNNSSIESWINECDSLDKDYYVLLSKKSNTCFIYVKNNKGLMNIDSEIQYINGNKCEATFYITETEYEDKYGYHFFMYEMDVTKDFEVKIFEADIQEDYEILKGKKCDVKVSVINEDISYETWREN